MMFKLKPPIDIQTQEVYTLVVIYIYTAEIYRCLRSHYELLEPSAVNQSLNRLSIQQIYSTRTTLSCYSHSADASDVDAPDITAATAISTPNHHSHAPEVMAVPKLIPAEHHVTLQLKETHSLWLRYQLKQQHLFWYIYLLSRTKKNYNLSRLMHKI